MMRVSIPAIEVSMKLLSRLALVSALIAGTAPDVSAVPVPGEEFQGCDDVFKAAVSFARDQRNPLLPEHDDINRLIGEISDEDVFSLSATSRARDVPRARITIDDSLVRFIQGADSLRSLASIFGLGIPKDLATSVKVAGKWVKLRAGRAAEMSLKKACIVFQEMHDEREQVLDNLSRFAGAYYCRKILPLELQLNRLYHEAIDRHCSPARRASERRELEAFASGAARPDFWNTTEIREQVGLCRVEGFPVAFPGEAGPPEAEDVLVWIRSGRSENGAYSTDPDGSGSYHTHVISGKRLSSRYVLEPSGYDLQFSAEIERAPPKRLESGKRYPLRITARASGLAPEVRAFVGAFGLHCEGPCRIIDTETGKPFGGLQLDLKNPAHTVEAELEAFGRQGSDFKVVFGLKQLRVIWHYIGQ